jgi:hypothetical protein
MVCRGLLLLLERAGEITLPPVSYVRHNPLAHRARPEPVLIDTTPIAERLRNLQPLAFEPVRRTADEPLFNSLMEEHHYLGYEQPVGEHLKYLVWAQGRPVACAAWSSAPRHIGARDRYIGWSAEARRRNIRFIAYNTRFLILPWVKVEHLASHILGRMAARISDDWQQMYGHPIYFLETFVDPERFRGTCYRAANWVWLGKTTGRGKQSNSYVPNRSIKEVLGYPLSRRFRELLEGQDESSQTTCGCQPGGTGPGAGPGARSTVERGRLRQAQECVACAGGNAGAAAQHREDQLRAGGDC